MCGFRQNYGSVGALCVRYMITSAQNRGAASSEKVNISVFRVYVFIC